MTDTIPAGTETAAAQAPGQMAPEPTDPSGTPSEADGAYEWITGLPLGWTRESTASDAAPPMRPARAIAFGA